MDESTEDLKHGNHPAIGQVAMLVNDIRLDYDQGRGTLAEVADRIIETVLNPKPTTEYKPLSLPEELTLVRPGPLRVERIADDVPPPTTKEP